MTRLFPTPRDERGVVAPSRLMLVAIVVVAIGGAMFFATTPKKDDPTAGSAANASSETSPAPSSAQTTPTGSATPKPSKTPKPSASPSAKPSATPSEPAPSEPAEPAKPVKKGKTRVAVFNNTGVKGLAQRTAQRVTGSGWKVTGAANWYGTIPSTTVYYPAGMESAAQSLAKDLGVRRVKPAVKPMREDRLTVILTSDYSA